MSQPKYIIIKKMTYDDYDIKNNVHKRIYYDIIGSCSTLQELKNKIYEDKKDMFYIDVDSLISMENLK